MQIHFETTNFTGTRIDKELTVDTDHVEDAFAELAQAIRWAKKEGSDKITFVLTEFKE